MGGGREKLRRCILFSTMNYLILHKVWSVKKTFQYLYMVYYFLHYKFSHVLLYVNIAGMSSLTQYVYRVFCLCGWYFNFVLVIILYMDVLTFIIYLLKFI